jgi:hypothetical protein
MMSHASIDSYVVLPSFSPSRDSEKRPSVDALHPGTWHG